MFEKSFRKKKSFLVRKAIERLKKNFEGGEGANAFIFNKAAAKFQKNVIWVQFYVVFPVNKRKVPQQLSSYRCSALSHCWYLYLRYLKCMK